MPAVLNAANEIAVNAFLSGMIRFTGIPDIIKKTMDHHAAMPDTELETVLEADGWARRKAQEAVKSLK
jgi:1-deoxy-D-xylulose-5-phosphate reductoisomerase